LRDELTEIRARGWALADEELAPGVRSAAAPVRDGTGTVRAALNVTVHAAETTTEKLLRDYLPLLLRTARRRQRRVGPLAVPPPPRGPHHQRVVRLTRVLTARC